MDLLRPYRYIVALLSLILVACSAPPVTRADIEALLYQDGDAPAGWLAGQVRDTMIGNAEGAELVASRELLRPGQPADEVAIAVYADADAARNGYAVMLPGVTSDGSVYAVGDEGRQRSNIVLFQRCRAVAYVRLGDTPLEDIGAYARRLDERLQAVVC